MDSTVVITYSSEAKPEKVELAGSFNNWKPTEMMRIAQTKWAYALDLSPLLQKSTDSETEDSLGEVKAQYKFVVDGEWKLDELDKEKPVVTDKNGNLNHLLIVALNRTPDPSIKLVETRVESEEAVDESRSSALAVLDEEEHKTESKGKKAKLKATKRDGCHIL